MAFFKRAQRLNKVPSTRFIKEGPPLCIAIKSGPWGGIYDVRLETPSVVGDFLLNATQRPDNVDIIQVSRSELTNRFLNYASDSDADFY